MKKVNVFDAYENSRVYGVCCAMVDDSLTIDDLNSFVRDDKNHLRNLSITYENAIKDEDSYYIREFFNHSHIPFRYSKCSYGKMVCCGCCMRECNHRCAQDVMTRVYLMCAPLLNCTDEVEKQKRYEQCDLSTKMLYRELLSDHPRFEVLRNVVNLYISRRCSPVVKEAESTGVNPYKLSYAPVIAYETRLVKLPNGEVSTREVKVLDPTTGKAKVYEWPQSGLCPFCIPRGTVDRRRLPRK